MLPPGSLTSSRGCSLAVSHLPHSSSNQKADLHSGPTLTLFTGYMDIKKKSIELFTLKKAIESLSNKDGDGYKNVT